MTVRPTDEQDGPAALTIYFAEQASNAASLTASQIDDKHAPAPSATEKSAVLDVKNLDYQQIWNKVKMVTGAQEIPATPEEESELRKFEQWQQQSEKDRVRMAALRQAKKDQERMLLEARGEVEKLREL